jgi:hypothetical protein
MQLDRLFVHDDDCFPIYKPSGLSSIRLISIDEKAADDRHLREIRDNIARGKVAISKEWSL